MAAPNAVEAGSTTGTIHSGTEPPTIKTEILIVGTGPAGASLACFLASHGEKRGDPRDSTHSH